MPSQEQNQSLKSAPEKIKSITPTQNQFMNSSFEDQNSQSINFLTQPSFLKLRNLTNYHANVHINSQSQVQQLLNRIEQLQAKVEVLQKKIKYKKKKRTRRRSQQIQKKHNCDVCNKGYGSLVSLNLHLRLKHAINTIAENNFANENENEEKIELNE